MLYTLPDGKKLDFARVESISKIRDYGQAENIVEKQHIGFAIHLKNKETIEVKETYHYSDWAEAKLRLNKIRNDIISEWEKYKTEIK
ncbi:MAG: hypothetical protein ABFC98_01585 [Candidatus Cloacimonas sp.]